MAHRRRRKQCSFCPNVPEYATQFYYVGVKRGGKYVTVTVDEKTVQVRTRPTLCYRCMLRFLPSFYVTSDYDECRRLILEEARKRTHVVPRFGDGRMEIVFKSKRGRLSS